MKKNRLLWTKCGILCSMMRSLGKAECWGQCNGRLIAWFRLVLGLKRWTELLDCPSMFTEWTWVTWLSPHCTNAPLEELSYQAQSGTQCVSVLPVLITEQWERHCWTIMAWWRSELFLSFKKRWWLYNDLCSQSDYALLPQTSTLQEVWECSLEPGAKFSLLFAVCHYLVKLTSQQGECQRVFLQ